MSDALPSAEALAKWFHDTSAQLAGEHNCGELPWDQITENERGLEVAVVGKFIDEYGPTLAVSRKVWDAAGNVWADWSIGAIDPARMEALRQALIEYGTVLNEQMPTDPIMRPYEEAAALLRKAVKGTGVTLDDIAKSVLALGARRAKEQRAGLRSR